MPLRPIRCSRTLSACGVMRCAYYALLAVDKEGKTVDFLLTAKRDKAAAKRFFDKAMRANDIPKKITMDKIGANKAAIDEIDTGMDTPMEVSAPV